MHTPSDFIPGTMYDWTTYADNDGGEAHVMPDADEFNDLDEYIDSEVLLPLNGDHMKAARVVGITRDRMGNEIGTYDSNPINNTRVYDVMFPDGSVEQYAANIIAENLVNQCNDEGQRYIFLDSILDHRFDGTESTISGSKTTRGVELCIQWKDGTTTWVPLKDMKETYPVETAEYAVSMKIDKLPAFHWWVPFTLRKRKTIIAAVAKRCLTQTTFMYGVELPGTVEDAYNIDKRNGNTVWRDAIAKEMKNVRVAFRILHLKSGFDGFSIKNYFIILYGTPL